jgi:hypothetical protein
MAVSQHFPAAEMLAGACLPAMGQRRTHAAQHWVRVSRQCIHHTTLGNAPAGTSVDRAFQFTLEHQQDFNTPFNFAQPSAGDLPSCHTPSALDFLEEQANRELQQDRILIHARARRTCAEMPTKKVSSAGNQNTDHANLSA